MLRIKDQEGRVIVSQGFHVQLVCPFQGWREGALSGVHHIATIKLGSCGKRFLNQGAA